MGARKSFLLNGIHFATKTALRAHCSAMLKQPSLSVDDERFLLALLDGHHERDQKIGCGVRRFYIAPSEKGTRCFWIERIDGSRTDFSIKTCMEPPTQESEVRAAFRDLIESQIIAFRDAAFLMAPTVACAITGHPVASEAAHVDHRPPATFVALVAAFLSSRQLTVNDVAIEPTTDGTSARKLVDGRLAQAWLDFHRANAKLQIVTKGANLSQGSRMPPTAKGGQ